MKYRESDKFLFSFRYQKFLKELKKEPDITRTPKKALHETSIPHIGILFDATKIEDKSLVLDFAKLFERIRAKVTLLGYLDHEADTRGLHFKHFTNKDRNFYFIPKNNDIDRFIQMEFDLLINTDLSQSLSIHFIACKAHAYTKVGPHSDFDNYYHLILDTKDTFTIKQYIRELIIILNKVSFNGRL